MLFALLRIWRQWTAPAQRRKCTHQNNHCLL